MYAVKCCVNLIDLCDTGSIESTQSYEQLLDDLLEQMGLYCGVCSEAIGKTKEQLDMLPCCHLIHTRYTTPYSLFLVRDQIFRSVGRIFLLLLAFTYIKFISC